MAGKPKIVAMDLEGVLIPEIWIAVAAKTGIDKLKLTTRDIPDYDELMRGRLKILKEYNLKLSDIQDVINTLLPLTGALDFLNWLRQVAQLIILSDTYYEFALPLMAKLNNPTLFCNTLVVDEDNYITDYKIRKQDGKKNAVAALKQLEFDVISIGDSYNDITMLKEAGRGILFRPPDNVVAEFPLFPVIREYDDLKSYLRDIL